MELCLLICRGAFEVDKKMIDFMGKFQSQLREFLGVNLEISWEENRLIIKDNLPLDYINTPKDTIGIIENSVNTLQKYYERDAYGPIISLGITEEVTLNMLSFEEDYTEEQFDFVQSLKHISSLTYESDCSKLGILLFKRNLSINNIEKQLNIRGVDFIKFASSKNIEELTSNKQTYKIIDGKSLALVVDKNYKVLGIAKKRVDKKSIKDQILGYFKEKDKNYFLFEIKNLFQKMYDDRFSDYVTEEIREAIEVLYSFLDKTVFKGVNKTKSADFYFVELDKKTINWHITRDVLFSFNGSRWKYKNLNIIKLCLVEKMYIGSIGSAIRNAQNLSKIIYSIDKLNEIVRNLANNNIGALFVILKDIDERRFIYSGEREYGLGSQIIPNGLFLDRKEDNLSYYDVLNSGGLYINIDSCDSFLLQLLASVDGCVAFDSSFNVISYGEFINNSFWDDRTKEEEEFPNEFIQGSRTVAAKVASKSGIAIKVSEDGNVDLWVDGKKILQM